MRIDLNSDQTLVLTRGGEPICTIEVEPGKEDESPKLTIINDGACRIEVWPPGL